MTPLEILNRFTAVADVREHLCAPWIDGEFAYASNGHWMVRVSAAGLDGLALRDKRHPNNVAAMFTAAPFSTLQPMGTFNAPALCPTCEGSALVFAATCTACDGKGDFLHRAKLYECQWCDGEGVEHAPAERGTEVAVPCPERTHTGFSFWLQEPVPYGNTHFLPGYLQSISTLPGVLFAPDPADPMLAAAFRFDGGEGLLMPCKPPTHNTSTSSKGAA